MGAATQESYSKILNSTLLFFRRPSGVALYPTFTLQSALIL